MNPLLLSNFTDDQREQAASIGELVDLSLVDKLAELFRVLLTSISAAEILGNALGCISISAASPA